MPVIRRGEAGDLPEVAAIQSASPEAAHWNAADYLAHDFWVALLDGRLAGFLVSRHVTEDEYELLNLVVAPEFRRRSVGRGLLQILLKSPNRIVYLEVRESNHPARNLYKSLGFKEVNFRKDYYDSPPDAAIVMKFHSC
jgi:[ribosomal protein S18]-alanine N-acetyltransferase